MNAVHISLIGTPQGKGRPRFVRSTGRVYTPAKTQKYEAALKDAAVKEMGQRSPMTGPLEVSMLAQFEAPTSWPKRKQHAALRNEIMPTGKPDADNLVKILDALNGVVWEDDAQVVTATVRKRYGAQALIVLTVKVAA